MNISVNLDALKNDERENLLRLIGKANKPMKEEFVCIKQRKDKEVEKFCNLGCSVDCDIFLKEYVSKLKKKKERKE